MKRVLLTGILILSVSTFAGCVSEKSDDEPNGTECYSELLENEISGGSSTADLMSIFNKCATVELEIEVNDERVYYGSTMVGLQSQEFDVLLLQLNATSIVTTGFDIMTYASFNLITLNESEYNQYLEGSEYSEISELSGLCYDWATGYAEGCNFEFELHEGDYYMIMDLS
tara:strand:- start:170 stop:682 length:513 start_codon:yes stop_codon:yes gene_type:complete